MPSWLSNRLKHPKKPKPAGREDMAQGMSDYQQAIADYAAKGNQQYTNAGDLADSGMANIKVDPRYAAHEQAALADLEQISKDGMSARDLADIAKNDSRVNRQAAGRQGAIRQNMAARGMSGSGMDLVAQMQSSQDATENQALASMEKNAQAQEGRRQAISQRGQLSGQLSARDFQQQAQQAQAQDSIARFNQANRQQVMNNNTQGANQFAGNVMQAQQGGAQMRYNSGTEQANRQIANKPKSAWDTTRDVIGMAGAGANIYSAFNTPKAPQQQQPLYAAHGAVVPGGKYSLGSPDIDSVTKDVVPAMLSPGERVAPTSDIPNFDRIDDPDVREYIKRKYGSEADMQQARDNEKLTKINAGVAGLTDSIANANRDPKVYHNSMQNLGQAPKITQNELQKTDMSGAVNAATKGRQELEGNRDEAIQAAFAERKAQLAAQAEAAKAAEDKRRFGIDSDFKTQAHKDSVDNTKAIREDSANQRGITNGFREREILSQEKAAGIKASEAEGALTVPGFERSGGVKQSPVEAQKAREAVGIADSIDKSMQLLQDKIKTNGSFEWGGTDGAEMDTIANDLRLQAKELYNLGVLSGPDLGLMTKQIPDTSSFSSAFTRDSTAQAQLASSLASFRRNIDAKMQAKGYSRSAQTFTPRTVYNGSQEATVSSQAELDEAMKEGFK